VRQQPAIRRLLLFFEFQIRSNEPHAAGQKAIRRLIPITAIAQVKRGEYAPLDMDDVNTADAFDSRSSNQFVTL
jgi:hypothetical protein